MNQLHYARRQQIVTRLRDKLEMQQRACVDKQSVVQIVIFIVKVDENQIKSVISAQQDHISFFNAIFDDFEAREASERWPTSLEPAPHFSGRHSSRKKIAQSGTRAC